MRWLLLVFLLAGCVSVAPDASGEEIFGALCARCHGSDMQGEVGPSLGPGSNAAEQEDDFLATTITRGRGRMPSFGSTLDDEQIERLIAYLRQRQAEDGS